MENFQKNIQTRPAMIESGSRDPIMALEALLQIKDGSFRDGLDKSVEESAYASSNIIVPLSLPLSSDTIPRKINTSSMLSSVIRTGKPRQHNCSYSQPNSGYQGSTEIPRFPTSNPLVNQVCDVKSAQFLKPIAPKEPKGQIITVRVEEVEAALRSKPQRGKKRDNLNGLERLELTRTRNREHAKNTRIRKKARYEELVGNETKYFELKGQRELNSKLIDNAMKFIDARIECMNKNLAEQSSSIWHISADDIRTNDNVASRKDKYKHETLLYGKLVEDTSCFKFEVLPQSLKSTEDGLTDLQMHDADVVFQVKSKVEKKAAFSFNILVNKDAIAISARNTIFVDFTLQLTSHNSGEDCQHIPLCSGIIHFQFANNSHKITSVKDIITYNCLSSLDNVINGDNFSLGNGTTYPSVVSLDH